MYYITFFISLWCICVTVRNWLNIVVWKWRASADHAIRSYARTRQIVSKFAIFNIVCSSPKLAAVALLLGSKHRHHLVISMHY